MPDALWKGSGTIMGILPTFEEYALYPDRLRRRRGILFREEDEVMLYRVLDIRLRLYPFGLGDIILYSADVTDPVMVLRCVRDASRVRDLIRQAVTETRRTMGVEGAEMLGAAFEHPIAPTPSLRSSGRRRLR